MVLRRLIGSTVMRCVLYRLSCHFSPPCQFPLHHGLLGQLTDIKFGMKSSVRLSIPGVSLSSFTNGTMRVRVQCLPAVANPSDLTIKGPIIRIIPDKVHCSDPDFTDTVFAFGHRKRNQPPHLLGTCARSVAFDSLSMAPLTKSATAFAVRVSTGPFLELELPPSNMASAVGMSTHLRVLRFIYVVRRLISA